ncbi:hypothetical protein DFQ03_2846 [Maribacter caenipelagi]|uniref:Uncharacterized protein n=1 Tax=Maribacter caenipelagi TaxID=1447781 RepID=A0A4R7CY93_9FLAO|nr:hypothetical protein [Maribacter caenipelagi]TDS13553.1 hypothetical protein DFQ03_2846 [Maribacter caenipelagi]
MDNEQKKIDDLTNIAKIILENTMLKIDIEGQNKINEELLEKIELKQNKYNEIFIENGKLRVQIEIIKDEVKATNVEEVLSIIRKLKDTLKDSDFHKKQYETLVREVDYVYVNQFDKLLWGDNYPSLKVFFDYLQKMNCLNINWSHFTNLMNYGNTEVINLNTGVLSKQDLGYLFYTIKPFFLSEFNNTVKRYIAIIKRKFLLNGKVLDDNFLTKRICGYKKSDIPTNLKLEEINQIALDIAKRHH